MWCLKKNKTKNPKNPKSEQNYIVNKLPQDERVYENKVIKTPKVDESSLISLSPIEKYINQYAEIAKEEMRYYGVPASIKLAQGILESSSGNGDLTQRSNNHFGIKCHGWKGEKVYHDDDQQQECFRKYSDASFSFRDHSLFLYERSRYRFLFNFKGYDYVAWARGLKEAGYATDPEYPSKLISLIERYDLDKYDFEVLGVKRKSESPKSSPKYELYQVKKGDTLYSISTRHNLSVEELKSINNLKDNQILVGQELKVKTQ